MQSRILAFASLFIIVGQAARGEAPAKKPVEPADLIVHEWGTFLAMQGSDGVTLDGMYHEEHALPGFVHSRSRDQLRLPSVQLKGETPVIYFYTKTGGNVSVHVGFPHGIWTQWYPQASMVGPTLAAPGLPPQLRNGRIDWSVEVIPNDPARPVTGLPETSADALWNFARDVDAAFVRAADRTTKPPKSEFERFIFYRGLGQATLPLEMTTADAGTLRVGKTPEPGLRHLFILRVENGKGVYKYLPALRAGEALTEVIPPMTDALPLDEFTGKVAADLANRLTECGLYPKEARAMVNTWRTSYFQTEGIRVLFVLPQRWTDDFIPIAVHPQPKQIVRVMVGRLEVLTPEREKLAENAVRGLASSDAEVRELAFAYLRDQGRYVEPIVRRVLRSTKDEQVRALCNRLILSDFVTELRAATNSATNGARIGEDPVFVRARLASLLREVGLEDEAKAEAEPVHAALQQMKAPPMTDHNARHYLRAYARTMEGLGDDAGAAERYGTFIRFGSQVRNSVSCTGCHQGSEGPRDMAWFRGWWAGKRFANYSIRTGQADKTMAEQEAVLARSPHDTTAQMMLAYLYEAKGDRGKAEKTWAKLGVPATKPNPVALTSAATDGAAARRQ